MVTFCIALTVWRRKLIFFADENISDCLQNLQKIFKESQTRCSTTWGGGGGESLLLLSKQLHLAILLKFTRFFFQWDQRHFAECSKSLDTFKLRVIRGYSQLSLYFFLSLSLLKFATVNFYSRFIKKEITV